MITGTVIGGEQAIARFDAMPGRLRNELRNGIGRATLLVLTRVKQSKLSGQVLNVRTGRLRRSINQRVTEEATKVTGIVGTNVEYAAAHEYGFNGIVSVREQLRTSVKGKSFSVRAHQRHMNVPEKSFLRSALADSGPEILLEFKNAAHRALNP